MSHTIKIMKGVAVRMKRETGLGTAHRFYRDTNAVAAIEFAMILPAMLILLLGMVEVSDAFNQDRKVSRMANAVADLVAQAETVTAAELDGVLALGSTILAPYPDDDLDIILASITFNNAGAASVDWSYDSNGACPWTEGDEPPITLPGTVASPNTSIVVGQANLTYTPTFAGLFTDFFQRASSIEMSDTYYLRPRLTGTVLFGGC